MRKESCPIAPAPDDQGKERQRPADSKSKVLNGLIWHCLDGNEALEARTRKGLARHAAGEDRDQMSDVGLYKKLLSR